MDVMEYLLVYGELGTGPGVKPRAFFIMCPQALSSR